MNTHNYQRGKVTAKQPSSAAAQRNGVRVMLATGATLATLIGAQSLAFLEQPALADQVAAPTNQPQDSSGVVIVFKDNSGIFPAATTVVPTAVPPVTATPFVTPATSAANTTKTTTSTPTATATSTATKTSTATATATKQAAATKAAVVVQPAPRTRTSR